MTNSGSSNAVTLIVAILGSAGFGAFVRELVAGLKKRAAGVASKESKRKDDIVAARERAEKDSANAKREASAAIRNAEIERENRYAADEVIALMRVAWISKGLPIAELPPKPVYEDTLTRAQIDKIIADEKL